MALLLASVSVCARAYFWLTIETWIAVLIRSMSMVNATMTGSMSRNSITLWPSFVVGRFSAAIVDYPSVCPHAATALHGSRLATEPAFGSQRQHIGGVGPSSASKRQQE